MIRLRQLSSLSPSQVIQHLKTRYLLNKTTSITNELLHHPPSSVYVGFDPTADSLHIGNLVTLIALLHFQQYGYQPIAVVGGATGLIGDPSGRLKERESLLKDDLEHNIIGISNVLLKIFQNASYLTQRQCAIPDLKIINNANWYKDMTIIEFMSNIGCHFRVSSMLNKESVHQRLNSGQGLSFTEFSYQVFQAYDYLYLHQNHNCWLQIGGGDQWGNISAGCEFVHKYTGNHVHGLTVPLVTTSSGEKLGKSVGNAVWLSADKTSPYNLYQYFLKTTDEDISKYLHYFTFESLDYISDILTQHQVCPEKHIAQKYLAEQVTLLIHGETGLNQAEQATSALFGDPIALQQLSSEQLDNLFQDVPTTKLSRDQCTNDTNIINIVAKTNAVSSKGEVRRLIQGGGLYVNNKRVESVHEKWSHDYHMLQDKVTVIRIGKGQQHLIKWI